MTEQTATLLREYARQYETEDFLNGDPSWFMHQVEGRENQEAMAFLASCLSYGSRPVFMKKIQILLDESGGNVHDWVREGEFQRLFRADDDRCFYRFYTHDTMNGFLNRYRNVMRAHGSLGQMVANETNNGYEAVAMVCRIFNEEEPCKVVPRDAASACKRVCMFLRWMVRKGSPVDLGLWADGIDRRTLVIPLDTHVLQQSQRLGLIQSGNASMSAALRITSALLEVFPDDPLRGDFALFGYGVNQKR